MAHSGFLRLTLAALVIVMAGAFGSGSAQAQSRDMPRDANLSGPNATYSGQEIIDAGHVFFGRITQGFAQSVERLVSQYGQPNGYILGQEGSGAFIGGLRYGEGLLYTRNAGNHQVFWQGPSIGFDAGGEGTRSMILVYNLQSIDALYQRYPGASGSAFVIGGVSVSAVENNGTTLAPIRTGVGARLGLNVGYLKFTREATWNPF